MGSFVSKYGDVDDEKVARRILSFLNPKRLDGAASFERACAAARDETREVVWRSHLSRAFGGFYTPGGGDFPV